VANLSIGWKQPLGRALVTIQAPPTINRLEAVLGELTSSVCESLEKVSAIMLLGPSFLLGAALENFPQHHQKNSSKFHKCKKKKRRK
jgi:hypothetical protein